MNRNVLTFDEEKSLLEQQSELVDKKHKFVMEEQEFMRRSENITHQHKLEQQRIFHAENRKNNAKTFEHKMTFLKFKNAGFKG